MPRFGLVILLLLFFISPQPLSAQTASDWPMAGHDPQRTSWSSEEVSGKLYPLWYKPFEPYILYRSQMIAADGKIFVTTARGLYALNADNGSQLWVYPTTLPLADTPTYANGVVYIGGFDKKLHAVNATDGKVKWTFTASQGFQVNPLVVNNSVYLGNRDGNFYALDATTGSLKWKFNVGYPIVQSAAYIDNTVYFAAQNSKAYALNASTGAKVWESAKLPGGGFHSWWPVISGNYVIFSGSMNHRPDGPNNVHTEALNWYMGQKEDIWPNYDTIPPRTLAGPIVSGSFPWAHGHPVMDAGKPNGTLSNAISEYLEDDGQIRFDRHTQKPWRRAFFVLDKSTGKEKTYDFDNDGKPSYAPITFLGTKGVNNRYPPILGPDGVLYLHMVYKSEEWIAGGGLVGWKPDTSLFSLVSNPYWDPQDEPHYNSGGGNMIYSNRCCDRLGITYDLLKPGTRTTHFSYDLIERIPGYRDHYWWPDPAAGYSHAYRPYSSFGRNGSYGFHGDGNPPIAYKGKVYTMLGNSVIAFSKTNVTPQKLAEAKISVVNQTVQVPSKAEVKSLLEQQLQKIVSAGHLRPGYVNSGLVDSNHNQCGDTLQDYWHHPSETIYFLLRALPHITNTTLKQQVRNYIQSEFINYPPYTINHIGWKDGANRQVFDLPPDVEAAMQQIGPSTSASTYSKYGGYGFNPFTFYALWQYAKEFGGAKTVFDTAKTKTILMNSFNTIPTNAFFKENPHAHNAYISGYIGYLELEKLAGYPQTGSVKSKLDNLLSLRVSQFYTGHPWDAEDLYKYCRAYMASKNFLYMVPELATYLKANALSKVQAAVNEYEYLTPFWFVSKAETEFGESVVKNIYDTHGLFQARAKVLNQPYNNLAMYIDVPAFEKGDLFYIDNLVSALEASGTSPTFGPSPTNIPNLPKPGDANGDGKVDGLDYVIWLNHYNQNVSGASNGDFDNNGKVDGLDYVIWLSNYGK